MVESSTGAGAKVAWPASPEAIRAGKARLRAWVKQRRAGLSPDFRAYAASAVLGNVERWPRFQEAGCVMAFASLLGEVDTMPILARILALGKRLVLPRVSPSRAYLEIYEVRILEHDLARQGKLGILEPLPTRCRRAEHVTIDLVLMPGLVFDARGGRIGYGAGYFDRLLATLCPMPELLAVAFDFQVLSRIPQFPEDVPMHGFATEAGLFRVRRKEWTCPSVGDTHAAARELDALVPADAVIGLCGPLGAGKTEWTRGFFAPHMREAGELASPSYALLNVYAGDHGPLAHIDLYRLGGAEPAVDAFPELPEILAGPGRHVVEWADVLPAALPRETVWVDFAVLHDGARRLEARWLEKIA